MQYDPADWISSGWDDGSTGWEHKLENCGEIIEFGSGASLEAIILELQRHQHECQGYH